MGDSQNIAVDRRREDALLTCSRLPVLEHFHQRPSICLAAAAILLNLGVFFFLVYFFHASCTTLHGLLPSESPPDDAADPENYIPAALAQLQDQGGVEILETSLIYYSATETFERSGATSTSLTSLLFWAPEGVTCGCGVGSDDCKLASCAGTIPIVVKYEQCPPLGEAFALATGLVVWLNVSLTVLLVIVLCLLPETCKKNGSIGFWGYVRLLSLQWP
ncbi:unnamed protein product [Pylaiella littoralis]